jgi:hypothetical protein
MQCLSDEQNRIDMKHVKEIKNKLYKSLDSLQIKNQFIIDSNIDVVIDTTFDVTSFDEFRLIN